MGGTKRLINLFLSNLILKRMLNVGNINVCAAMPASSRNLIKSNCCLQRGRNFSSGMKAIIFLVTAFKEASEGSKEQVNQG